MRTRIIALLFYAAAGAYCAAADTRSGRAVEPARAGVGHVLAPETDLTLDAFRELAAQDAPEAVVLTAALSDPAFIDVHRASLETLLGGPDAVRTLEAKAKTVSGDAALKAEADAALARGAPRAVESLRLALASSGRALDGALAASETPGVEIPELRRGFNANFLTPNYDALLGKLKADSGIDTPFTVSHTPVFVPGSLLEKLIGAGRDIMAQLTTPEYIAQSNRAIPAEFNVRNEPAHPMFVQVDFGMAKDPKTGQLEPKLVELQGFPSLYAFAASAGKAYKEAFGLPDDLRFLLGGHDQESYKALMREAIVGKHDPKNVVLLEIDPWRQGTRNDFLLTEKMLGIKTVDVNHVEKVGKRLFYRDAAGDRVRIERIYNRVVVDELVKRRDVRMRFKLTDDLDVEWAGHPNWFLRMSKFSLPFIRHETSPPSVFLDQVDLAKMTEEEAAKYVLKPWDSLGGSGVNIHPTKADLLAVPEDKRAGYILQERVDFQPFIETPYGLTKAEIRIMFIWLDGMSPVPVSTVTRLTRGLISGVGHNRGVPWAGSSSTLYRP